MQRSHLLRWLALAIGLLGTQCLDSLSDDCTKTLTCDDDQQPTLRADCQWRYPNGQLWTGAPHYDRATGKWRWPDGKETATQDFKCDLGLADAGTDAGPAGPDCRLNVLCDEGLVCDPATGGCFQCVGDADCAGNMPMGDAGAATVCDTVSHRCVECLRNQNCSGDTSVCKVDAANSRRNACVECTDASTCPTATPICDERSNDCTSVCQSSADCTGDKKACNTSRNICVECTDNDNCTTGDERLCDTESNQCVQCLDDAPCAADGRVCDLETHSCVECQVDEQCLRAGFPYCDTETKQCVPCLNDQQCTVGNASRCSAAHVCTGCTDDTQCEGGGHCRSGTCVECLNGTQCTDVAKPVCETTQGRCVGCLENGQCTDPGAAHCETNLQAPLDKLYTCVPCVGNLDCTGDGKALPPFCNPNRGGGTCSECITEAECSDRGVQLSRCGNGTCSVCVVDDECALFADPPENAPACKPDFGCVQCTENADCDDIAGKPVCKIVAGGGPAAINTCVQCIDNGDCLNPAASLCQNNQCVPCDSDDDCSLVDSNGTQNGGTPLHVCDASTCVECTGPKNGACASGTNVCDSTLKTCTQFPLRSADLCEACVADNQCATTQRCATHLFGTTPLGPFCFPAATGVASNVCNLTPYSGLTASTTVDGVAANLCTLRRTTCAGLADFSVQACDAAADCGEDGLDDGRCDEGSGTCSLPCTTNVDCFDPGTNSCLGGICQL